MANDKPRLEPSVRTSGGNPAGFPDYKPINKLPEHELRALANKLVRPQLYQVWVEDRERGAIPVFPRCEQDIAMALAAVVLNQIRTGTEKQWSNPIVLPVLSS